MHTNGKIFDFDVFRRPVDFIQSIYFHDISLKQAISRQDEMEYLLRNLQAYRPKKPDKIKSMEEVLNNAKIFFRGRKLIVCTFEENIFPLPKKKCLNMKNGQKKNIFLQKKIKK